MLNLKDNTIIENKTPYASHDSECLSIYNPHRELGLNVLQDVYFKYTIHLIYRYSGCLYLISSSHDLEEKYFVKKKLI